MLQCSTRTLGQCRLWMAPALKEFLGGFCGRFRQHRRLSGLFMWRCSARLHEFRERRSNRLIDCWLRARCDVFRYLSFIISSLKASVGVRRARHFLGAPFRRSQITFLLRLECAMSSVSRGRYRRARLFRFSTVPFCHGDEGSQNQLSVPMPGLSLRHARNSKPRSNVIDFRAGRGRGSITSISLLTKWVELQSLLRNRTANRVFRSTNEATFIVPRARSRIIKSPSHSPKVSRFFT